jgi:nitronate monooxygenase
LTSVLSGRPARGLLNSLIEYAEADPGILPADYPLAYDLAKHLFAAYAKAGDHTVGAYWAGQGAALIRELPAAELIQVLVNELNGDA